MKVGYVRVSTQGQNTARQEVLMRELGVDMVFIDRQSGKDMSPPELQQKYMRLFEHPELFIRIGNKILAISDKS